VTKQKSFIIKATVYYDRNLSDAELADAILYDLSYEGWTLNSVKLEEATPIEEASS
jgi:hypothetical protein